jgi:peptidoglycan/LPS O-acetylase OafA/YrhL
VTTTPQLLTKKSIQFDILDSIRGIAALYVAIAHCRGVLWVGGDAFMQMFSREHWGVWEYVTFGTSMLTRLAVEFVIVFFVLSGFSIAHSLSGNKSPLQFYKRRFIRIYPSYVVALAWAGVVFLITRYWFPQWYDGSLKVFSFVRTVEMNDYFEPARMAKNLLYMPGGGFITPFWSLTYEIIFYLLAPFLLRRINLYVIVSAILFAVNFILPGQVIKLSLPVYIHEFIFNYNIYFAVGVFLYSRYEVISGWFAAYTKREFFLIFAGLVIIMYGANIYLRIESVFTFIEAAMLSVMLIIFFLKYSIRIPWLMGVGKFSYTLYITHFASIYLYLGIYWLIVKPEVPYIVNYLVWIPAVFFVVAIALIQYFLVEKRTKHILNLLRRKTVSSEQPVVTHTATRTT